MRPRLRGFVLLTTMFFALVLGMILYAAMTRLPAVSQSRSHGVSAQRARLAAQSGMEYAACQLRANPLWSGGEARQVIVDSGGLKVTQEQGNVLGEITEIDGTKSSFRIRFNYQDGDGGDDEKPDPSGDFLFELPYVSLNNLASEDSARLPHTAVQVPGRSVCLYVEGESQRSGGRPVKRTMQSIYQISTDGRVKDAVIMAGGDLYFDLGHVGNVNLGGSLVKHASDDLLRLRTKGGLEVRRNRGGGTVGNIALGTNTRAELGRDENRGGVQANYPADQVTEVQEQVNDERDFYNLPWENVPKAADAPDATTAAQIPGGVYVYGESPDNPGTREIRYFDMTYQQYLNRAETLAGDPSQGVVLSPDLREVRTDENLSLNPSGFAVQPAPVPYYNTRLEERVSGDGFQWRLKDIDLRVLPSARGHDGIAIVPRKPAKLDFDDPRVFPEIDDRWTPDNMRMLLLNTSFTADGDIHIQGGIAGVGGVIVGGGTVEVIGGRAITVRNEAVDSDEVAKEIDELTLGGISDDATGDPDGDGFTSTLQLNIYSKKDMTLSTYVERLDSYRNMAFQGLLYSWGDINLKAARPDSGRRGTVKLRGALVAYGASPISEAPGSEGRGNVRIQAADTTLTWDPRFLPSLGSLQAEGSTSPFTLEQVLLVEIR